MQIFLSESISPDIKPIEYPDIKIGFHGTEERFKKFANRVTFFSRTPDFAASYAEDKAMYNQSDAAIYILECDISGINFFNASNPKHLQKLANILPDEVRIHMLYGSADLAKDELLEELQGIQTIYPIDEKYWKGKHIGDSFYYNGSNKTIIDITKDFLIVMETKEINWIAEYSGTIDSSKYSRIGAKYEAFKDTIFKEYNEAQKKLANKYDDSYGRGYFFLDATSEEKAYLDGLYRKAINNLIEYLKTADDFHRKKYTLKPLKLRSDTNYQMFESIMEYILKAGFEGHISMESYNGVKDFTYAVYRPDKVKILDMERYRD